MHLMATNLWFLIDCAIKTYEKVPSPFFAYKRYWSITDKHLKNIIFIILLGTSLTFLQYQSHPPTPIN